MAREMADDKDFNIIRLVRRGDSSSMEELYRRYIGYLTAACSRYIVDADALRDVLQTSFEKIFSSAWKFSYRGPGSLRAWMTRIAVNEALKYLKQKSKADLAFTHEMPDVPEDEDPDTHDIPMAVLQEMIRNLPEGYRTVFNLFVFEEMSHKEIASVLGITESTSASQFHRARNILARRIREYRSLLETTGDTGPDGRK